MDTISGIAMDPDDNAELETVELSIKRISNDCYWDGTGWTVQETWLPTDLAPGEAPSTWEFDSRAVSWSSKTPYQLQCRATDIDNNVEIPSSSVVFALDMENPSSTIVFPGEGLFLNNLENISGLAMDTGGSGVDYVEISITQLLENKRQHWTGERWGNDETWLVTKTSASTRSTTETVTWSINANNIDWVTDKYYTISSRATDKVGNLELDLPKVTFMYDNRPPECSILINEDQEFTNNPFVELSLFAQDSGSGVTEMTLRAAANGSEWTAWEPFTSARAFTLPPGDGEKLVYLRVQDKAGNIAEPVFDSIILDTTPPQELSIVINNNAEFTNSLKATLSLFAFDTLSGLANMSFSFNKLTWTEFELFVLYKTINLPARDGEKTVYFKVTDNAGNLAEPVSDNIILDTTPPQYLSIVINKGFMETNSTAAILNVSAYDELSGVDKIAFSTDGNNWSMWEPYIQKRVFNLSAGDGEKVIYFRAVDRVGNVAEPVNTSIILNTTIPEKEQAKPDKVTERMETWLFWLILLIIIISLIILGLMKRRRDRKKQQTPDTPPAPTSSGYKVSGPTMGPTPKPQAQPPSTQIQVTQSPAVAAASKIATPIAPAHVVGMPPIAPVAKPLQLPPAGQIKK